MILQKIRNGLIIGLGIFSMMACAYGAIVHVRAANLSVALDEQLVTNADLVETNRGNLDQLDRLIKQRDNDNKLIASLRVKYTALAGDHKLTIKKLEVIKNAEPITSCLYALHPIGISGLFNGGDSNESSDGNTEPAD